MGKGLTLNYKNILSLSFPIMLGGFIQFIVNFTDTAFVGQLGEVPLNAVGNAGLIFITLFVVGQGFGTAVQILVARRNGEGKTKQVGIIFDHAILLSLLLAVILVVLMFVFSRLIMPHVVQDQRILEGMSSFLDYRVWGYLFAITQTTIIGYYMGIAQSKVLGYATFLTAILNVFLDYTLIYGKLGFPNMGIEGAGLASTIAEAMGLFYVLIYQRYDKSTKTFGLYSFKKIKRSIAQRLLKIAYPLIGQRFVSLFAWSAFFLMIEKTGSTQLAISQIVRSLYFLAFIPIFGFGSAASTFVSDLMAKKDPDQVIVAIKKIGWISGIFTFVFVHGYLFYPEPIVGLLTNDPYLVQETIPILKLIVTSMLIHSFVMVIFSAVSGVGDTKWAFIIESTTIVFYLIFCYYVCIVNPQSLFVIWSAEFLYFGLLALFSIAYFKWSNWRTFKL